MGLVDVGLDEEEEEDAAAEGLTVPRRLNTKRFRRAWEYYRASFVRA